MREAGKSTPAQSEKTTKGLPVPVWSIAFLAIIALAVIFGPSLIAGMVEASASNQATNPGASGAEIEAIVVSEEDEDPEKETPKLIDGASIGYHRIYYPVGEIPDRIYVVSESEDKRGSPIVLEDFETEDELIRFTIVHLWPKVDDFPCLEVKVEYLNHEGEVFFKTYRADTEDLGIDEERKQKFGQPLLNLREREGVAPCKIKGITILT